MDAFESIVAALLERKGFWTRTSVKVELTKEEKRKIGRPSSPRWEIDVIAYKGSDNSLLVVECKSYLDSYGVRYSSFIEGNVEEAKRYKLFTDSVLREVVLNRLSLQLVESGFCPSPPQITLCLVAGKIYQDAAPLHEHFKKNGWLLWDPDWLCKELYALAESGYDNTVVAVVSKLLERNRNKQLKMNKL
jgi:hypothetical protein